MTDSEKIEEIRRRLKTLREKQAQDKQRLIEIVRSNPKISSLEILQMEIRWDVLDYGTFVLLLESMLFPNP